MSNMPDMPPLPRDHQAPTVSEMIPFRSKKINIRKSNLLVPLVATAIFAVFLFGVTGSMSSQALYARAVGAYLVVMVLWLVWSYSGTTKPMWVSAPAVLITAIGLPLGLFLPFAIIFRDILPGGIPEGNVGFVQLFIGMFFGAGLCEEAYKQVPTVLAAWLAWRIANNPGQQHSPVLRTLALRTPLDGLLIGVASGAGFILMETLFEYFDRFSALAAKDTGNAAFGALYGLQLVIPRTLQSISGHMGWSGILGYFIGLALIRRSMMWQLALGGWLVVSLLHGLWNSVGAISPWLGYVVAFATVILFISCLLKARQLEGVLTGRTMASSGSILVGATTPLAPAGTAPAGAVPIAAAIAPARVAAAPVAEPVPAKKPRKPRARKAAEPAVEAPAATPTGFRLSVGGITVPLKSGQRVDLSAAPELGGNGGALMAEVSVHPSDPTILGLKNLSSTAWTVTAPDGRTSTVAPSRSLRLDAGLRIAFGPLVGTVA